MRGWGRKTLVRTIGLIFLVAFAAGCISGTDYKGVRNHWRDPDAPPFVVGETTQREILERLGPPSQVIGLEQFLVFYYLLEETDTSGFVLIIYNSTRKKISYDRAIFFFDHQGVLVEFATSDEALEHGVI